MRTSSGRLPIVAVLVLALAGTACGPRPIAAGVRNSADEVIEAVAAAVRAGAGGLDEARPLPTQRLDDIDGILSRFPAEGDLVAEDAARLRQLREAQAALAEARAIQHAVADADTALARGALGAVDDAAARQGNTLDETFREELAAVTRELTDGTVCGQLLGAATGTTPSGTPAEALRDVAISRLASRWGSAQVAQAIDWALWANGVQETALQVADALAGDGTQPLYQTPDNVRYRAGEAYLRHCLPRS